MLMNALRDRTDHHQIGLEGHIAPLFPMLAVMAIVTTPLFDLIQNWGKAKPGRTKPVEDA